MVLCLGLRRVLISIPQCSSNTKSDLPITVNRPTHRIHIFNKIIAINSAIFCETGDFSQKYPLISTHAAVNVARILAEIDS